MTKLSNSYILRIVTRLLILLALAKAISLAVLWLLPSDGVELQVKNSYKPRYQRVDFKNMLDSPSSSKVKTTTKKISDGINITNMVLKGLYGKGESGFAILALKSSAKKTSIVSIGESFSKYKLKTILSDGVVFTKLGKEYILKIEHSKLAKASKNSFVRPIVDNKRIMSVNRNDINSYASHPKKLWRDISIVEVKDGAKTKGFKVTNIKRRSKMQKLGLKKGDIIIRANNIEMTSYREALGIYKNIDNLDTIQIVVIRNNQEKELVYEIN